MEFLPTLSPRHVVYVKDYILRCDADPNSIFAEADWELSSDAEQHQPIPVANLSRIFEHAAEKLNDPDFGIHTAENFPYESSGLMTLAFLSAADLDQALKMLVRYDKYIDSGFEVTQTRDATTFTIKLLLLDPLRKDRKQLNEYVAALFTQLIRSATKKPLNPLGVQFEHDISKDSKPMDKFFSAPISFGTENKLIYPLEMLNEKFVTAHYLMFDILSKALQSFFRAEADEQDMMNIVSREIIKHTSFESLSIDTVADELSMSSRTLRRKLAAEGHSFQDIKKAIRLSRARYFISSTSMTLGEISFELGYSEISAFSRAFRSWVGESPQSYRQKNQAKK